MQRPVSWPLLQFGDGSPLTKDRFITLVRAQISRAGIDPTQFKGHSFRIGATTTAAACGIHKAVIKWLGRWSSSVYQTYVQLPPEDLPRISSMMAQGYS